MDGAGRHGRPSRHVLIVGGGASGALMAAQLLARSGSIRVTIIEKSQMLGCGLAYATDHPGHLLNTRVRNMSAFPAAPDHFLHWLNDSGEAPRATGDCFIGRGIYGRYIESVIAPWLGGRLRCLSAECVRVAEDESGIGARLADGTTLAADTLILATGHAVPATPAEGLRGGWDFTPPSDPDGAVVIIGTGLSMVDHVLSLLARGHRGPISCLSRRALLPRPHGALGTMVGFRRPVPLGAPVSATLRWLRAEVAAAEAAGAAWQDTVDALKPHVSAIWQAWDLAARRRFLRHGAAWWEVHRHRMPPQSAAIVAEARARGQLRLLRGRFDRLLHQNGRPTLAIATPAGAFRLEAGHVIDCRGIRRDPATDSAPVILDLLARGLGRIDPLGLGLDTTADGRLLSRAGTASDRIFAIGPCARGALWEITAIPDIRVQCAELAGTLAAAVPTH